jgi:hypothetical protein
MIFAVTEKTKRRNKLMSIYIRGWHNRHFIYKDGYAHQEFDLILSYLHNHLIELEPYCLEVYDELRETKRGKEWFADNG